MCAASERTLVLLQLFGAFIDGEGEVREIGTTAVDTCYRMNGDIYDFKGGLKGEYKNLPGIPLLFFVNLGQYNWFLVLKAIG